MVNNIGVPYAIFDRGAIWCNRVILLLTMTRMTHVSYDSNEFASEDDAQLAAHGYVSSFKREFSNLATISFAFAIMVRKIMDWISTGTTPMFYFQGMCSSIATTFNTPLLLGGPASVVWCWIIGHKSYLEMAVRAHINRRSMHVFHAWCFDCRNWSVSP